MTIRSGSTDKCPHCRESNRFESIHANQENGLSNLIFASSGEVKRRILNFCRCTHCHEIIIFLGNRMIFPLSSARPKVSKEVPEKIAEDYTEACLVEPLSKKSAGAMGRRCLQTLLHDQGIKKANLSKEIDEAMKTLPSYLSNAIDAIRNIGNFSAHPIKIKNTGEIVDVETTAYASIRSAIWRAVAAGPTVMTSLS